MRGNKKLLVMKSMAKSIREGVKYINKSFILYKKSYNERFIYVKREI